MDPLNLVIASWILSTIASVFAAKYACDDFDVDAIVLSMIQFFVASTILMTVSIFTNTPFQRPSHKHLLWLLVVSIGVFLREALKFAAVAHIDINLFNSLKALGPAVLVLLDGAIYKVWPARNTILPFCTIVFGGLVMGFASFGSVEDMLKTTVIMGSTCAILSTLVECAATIGQKWVLRDAKDMDDATVQYYLSSFSLVFSFFSFLDNSSHHGSQMPSVTVREGSSVPLLTFALVASSLLAFISTQLSIKSLRKISAARYTILDTMRRLLSSVLAVFVFGENMNTLSAGGLGLSLIGIYMYNKATRGNEAVKNAMKLSSKAARGSKMYSSHSEFRPTDDIEQQKVSIKAGKYGKSGAVHQEEEDQLEQQIVSGNYISSEYTPLVASKMRYPTRRCSSPVRITDIESIAVV